MAQCGNLELTAQASQLVGDCRVMRVFQGEIDVVSRHPGTYLQAERSSFKDVEFHGILRSCEYANDFIITLPPVTGSQAQLSCSQAYFSIIRRQALKEGQRLVVTESCPGWLV